VYGGNRILDKGDQMQRFTTTLLCMLAMSGLGQAWAQNDDYGNTCETGTIVELNSEPLGTLTANDADVFLFQVTNPNALVTISTLGETSTSGRLFQLVDGVPILLTEGWLSGGYNISQPSEASTYCLEVLGRNTDALGSYVLQIQGEIFSEGSCSGASVSLSALSLGFGVISVGELSAPQAIMVTNNGIGQLFIDTSTLTGANAVEFGILNDACAGRVLQPGEQCTLQGIFAPLGAGSKTASVTIPCNELDSLPLEVQLAGAGIITPTQ
jgi:hypothetical protein